jgi:hypothetical protein
MTPLHERIAALPSGGQIIKSTDLMELKKIALECKAIILRQQELLTEVDKATEDVHGLLQKHYVANGTRGYPSIALTVVQRMQEKLQRATGGKSEEVCEDCSQVNCICDRWEDQRVPEGC